MSASTLSKLSLISVEGDLSQSAGMELSTGAEAGVRISANRRWSVAWRELAILIGLSVTLAMARWCILDSFWGDSPRWIFEAYRGSSGDLLYKDFAWQYPPLPLLVFSASLRLFGSTFAVVQMTLDLLSAAVVILTWDFARRLLPKPLPVLVAAALACAGASNSSNFALFSLQIYTPAILVGMMGLLIVLREIVDYLQTGQYSVPSKFWISTGATICLLSKPEFVLGALGCLAALALSDLRLWYRDRPRTAWITAYAKLLLVSVAPAACIYFVVAAACGLDNVIAGVGGYGLASLSCPWWPTGLGLFGALVGVGYGVIVASLFSLTRVRLFLQRFGNRYWWLWGASAASLLLAVLYLPYCAAELPMFHGRLTISHTLTYLLSTGTALIPVMWCSILLWAILVVRFYRAPRTAWTIYDGLMLMILTAAVLMSVRGLFSGTMSQLSLASVAAYPLWFVIGPHLLIRFLGSAEKNTADRGLERRRPPMPVVALIGAFIFLRFAALGMTELKAPHAKVVTPAGSVRLKDMSVAPQMYAYLSTHTAPREPILDLALGGGLNFSDHRPSPIFSTQFTALAPPAKYLALDDFLLRQHAPRIVVANGGENFQATYGICMNTGCTFPSFVWRSKRLACNPLVEFPMFDYIRRNYEARASFGDKVVYFRKGT